MKANLTRLANSILWRFGGKLRGLKDLDPFETLFYRHFDEEFFFVQIGANDGIRADPIHDLVKRHNLRGVTVEPLRDMFDKLRAVYASSPQVIPVNVAIHRTQSEVVLYRVKPDAEVGDWAHGIASLDPKHHELSGTSSEHIIEEHVRAITLNQLLHDHQIIRCDAFIIDTEGYDAEIISMLLSTELRPNIIMFEHGMLDKAMTREIYREIVNELISEGYNIITDEGDAFAYKSG